MVSPIGVLSTTVEYYYFDCNVIYQNGTNTAAGWDVVISPTPGVGSGIVGAQTLSALYSQDSTNHYAQYTTGNVYADGTPANESAPVSERSSGKRVIEINGLAHRIKGSLQSQFPNFNSADFALQMLRS